MVLSYLLIDFEIFKMCLVFNCIENNMELCLNISEENCELFVESLMVVKCFKIFVYFVILLILFFGNLVVIFIVWKNECMWIIMNFLIFNMVVLDLLIFVFVVLCEFMEIYVGKCRWFIDGVFGLILCKFVYVF